MIICSASQLLSLLFQHITIIDLNFNSANIFSLKMRFKIHFIELIVIKFINIQSFFIIKCNIYICNCCGKVLFKFVSEKRFVGSISRVYGI